MTARVLLTIEQYLDEVLALAPCCVGAEVLPLAQAAGRTLASPVTSRGLVPAFDNSAMDGFAVRHADLAVGVTLREVASVAAGSGEDPSFGPGECVRIMTGAPMPSDGDTVIQRELVTETPGGIVINELVVPGRSVRMAGEDLHPGDEVLPRGHVLDARALSLAAACGRAEVEVARRPVVGVASTGDELISPAGELERGQIFESNSVFLAHAAERDGATALTAVLSDDEDAFARGIDQLAATADLIVLSGGVSVGDFDVVRIVLSERAGGTFRHVIMQPGKPQGWARWTTPSGRVVPIIALPGNPLSAAVSYELFVRPVLDRMVGRPSAGWTPAVAAEEWTTPKKRRQIIPVTIEVDGAGVRRVRRAHPHGSASHMVSAMARADALASVPAEVERVHVGDVLLTRSLV